MNKSEGMLQVRVGAFISYALIIANALFGLFVSPFILRCIGESSYGVYRTIASLSSAVMVLDFGLGGTMMRYIAKFKANKEENKIQPFVSMSLCEASILALLVAIVAALIFINIPHLYANSFTVAEIALSERLFIILAFTMILQVIENVFNGIITGHNNFALGNGVKLIRLLARIVLYVILLPKIGSAITLVTVDLILTMLIVVCESIYVRFGYRIKFTLNFKKWDKVLFRESFLYALALFLTSIAAQVNNNLDNVIIGAIKGAEYVTVYSFGLLIFGMFEQLSTSISGVMLPTVTNVLVHDKTGNAIKQLVIKVGRVQFMLMGAAAVGFIILGKDFISLWLGDGFSAVYVITLILIFPAMLELCVNVCLSILRAENCLGFRTTILFASTVLNLIVTYVAVKYWNYIGAAFGTAASFIIGSVVIMNIYYKKKLGLPMLRIYGQIFNRIWVCLLLAGGALWAFSRFFYGTLWSFVIGVAVFAVVYGGSLLFYGFNKEEKQFLKIGGRRK